MNRVCISLLVLIFSTGISAAEPKKIGRYLCNIFADTSSGVEGIANDETAMLIPLTEDDLGKSFVKKQFDQKDFKNIEFDGQAELTISFLNSGGSSPQMITAGPELVFLKLAYSVAGQIRKATAAASLRGYTWLNLDLQGLDGLAIFAVGCGLYE